MTTDAKQMSTPAAIGAPSSRSRSSPDASGWCCCSISAGHRGAAPHTDHCSADPDNYISANSVDLGAVMRAVGIGLGAVVVGGIVRAGLVRLVRQASTGLSDLRVSVFSHLMQRSMLTVRTERTRCTGVAGHLGRHHSSGIPQMGRGDVPGEWHPGLHVALGDGPL